VPDHFAIPFTYDATGSASVLQQDTLEEVSQCVRVLLSTPTGTRVEQFDYGIPDPTFTDDAQMVAQITAAVGRWEPRAAGIQVAVTTQPDGTASITAKIPQERR
jgi:phage baseplate assembly protein W